MLTPTQEQKYSKILKKKFKESGLMLGDYQEFAFIEVLVDSLEEQKKELVEKIEEEKFIVTESSGEYTGWIHNRSMNKGIDKAILAIQSHK
jgi:pantothenate kinase type III